MDIFLETKRLILRQFTVDDVDLLFDLDNDPEVMRFLSGGPATPRVDIANTYLPAFLAYYERSPGYGFWATVERSSGSFIGWCHLRPQVSDPPDRPELGYRLKKAAWNKGFATEMSRALIDHAFGAMGAAEVYAQTYRDNTGSRRVMEKCGMRLIRAFRFTPEELHALLGVTNPSLFPDEEVEYAITRSEWDELRRRRPV
jgi:RimJ/RimL family protein N-acetyltransferase